MSSTGNVTHLDTKKFADTINVFKTGITEYNDIKQTVERTTKTLFGEWEGEGKTQFEKDYNTLYQQLTDIADIMYELYDALVDAEAAYIAADEEAAKMLTID
ncbi:WXG100 family type VII secretion target [Bariatricus sp. HCP28S3_A7]|uniref:WXG100 family type VII secretion target n=1 Tax=Bariatricus sp. HCP28S3_A7 TaxID=3438894 RepID=UPI003F89F452